MTPSNSDKPGDSAQSERDRRLAVALKENLRRRKAAAAARPKPQAIKNKEKF